LTVATGFDAAEVDRDIIAQRLQEDVAESKGKVYKHIASSLSSPSIGKQIHHKSPVTCISQYGMYLYTACKNGIIEKWNVSESHHPKRVARIAREKDKKVFTGHTDDVLAMTISGDGKFLATGGKDKRICVWETSTMNHLKTFTQHRGPIMVLSQQFSTNELESGMSFINKSTLFL
jgi:ribosomal RNA-processing protein 9